MKSIRIKDSYGFENISLEEESIPVIKNNEVLVKVEAISLNQLDLMIAKGFFERPLPHTLGSDAAGQVIEVGKDVSDLKMGDKVSTHFIHAWQSGNLNPDILKTRLGMDRADVFSEYIALPASAFVKIPSHLTYKEGATLPIAALTAWEALVNAGKLEAGQTVLLQGTGGVSIFALQFAKAMGARVIITSGSDHKLERAQLLGADETINYNTDPNWQNKVLALTGGAGVDIALEMSWAEVGKTFEAMKLGGKVVVVGLLGGSRADFSVFDILHKSLSVIGVQVGSKKSFEAMNEFMEIHTIRPVIDREYSLDQTTEAFEYMEKGSHFGKVVVAF